MSVRSKVPVVARTLLGLAFLVFGANFFLHFLPEPAPPPEAGAFLGALVSGKILTIAKVIEVTAGVLLIGNRFVPLALTVLAPVEIGILAFHGVFAPAGLPLPLILVALTAYLAWAYRAAFAPMLRARVEPVGADPVAAHPAG
ncbi:MAG: DoxX family protein [Kofleriaceae bacterium]